MAGARTTGGWAAATRRGTPANAAIATEANDEAPHDRRTAHRPRRRVRARPPEPAQ